MVGVSGGVGVWSGVGVWVGMRGRQPDYVGSSQGFLHFSVTRHLQPVNRHHFVANLVAAQASSGRTGHNTDHNQTHNKTVRMQPLGLGIAPPGFLVQ